jgi:hypothetical protein
LPEVRRRHFPVRALDEPGELPAEDLGIMDDHHGLIRLSHPDTRDPSGGEIIDCHRPHREAGCTR